MDRIKSYKKLIITRNDPKRNNGTKNLLITKS